MLELKLKHVKPIPATVRESDNLCSLEKITICYIVAEDYDVGYGMIGYKLWNPTTNEIFYRYWYEVDIIPTTSWFTDLCYQMRYILYSLKLKIHGLFSSLWIKTQEDK